MYHYNDININRKTIMATIKLFHGSSNKIETPSYLLGKPNNDYGKGFYCTQDIELAKE